MLSMNNMFSQDWSDFQISDGNKVLLNVNKATSTVEMDKANIKDLSTNNKKVATQEELLVLQQEIATLKQKIAVLEAKKSVTVETILNNNAARLVSAQCTGSSVLINCSNKNPSNRQHPFAVVKGKQCNCYDSRNVGDTPGSGYFVDVVSF